MIDGFAYTDTHEHQERILSILRLLRPYEQVGAQKIRVGRDNDGGYIMVDDFDGVTAAYSLGINDDVSWDKQMAARDIDILQFDHTIDALPESDPHFHWSRTGICGVGEERDGFRSLPDIIQGNGHAEGDLVLKMDIEGAEWSVFATMPLDLMARFRQIVCEFHGFQHVDRPDFFERAAAACRNLSTNHRVVHVHANNNTAYAIVGGVPIPACLEITLSRTQGRSFQLSSETFPTPIDQPCWPGRADYTLGRFEF